MTPRMTIGQKTFAFAATLSLVASFAAVATPTFAAVATPAKSSLQSGLESAAPAELKTGTTDLPKLIGNIIGSLMSIIGALLFVYLLYGGFTYMTAGGDETKVKNAVAIIRNCVIGIVIVVLAYSISSFIIGTLGNATSQQQAGAPAAPSGQSGQ